MMIVMGNTYAKTESRLKAIDPITVPVIPHQNEIVPAKIINVYDGDTIEVMLLHGDKLPMRIWIRLIDVDTPELKGKDVSNMEKAAAIIVRDQVREWLVGKVVPVRLVKWDKFGGRIDGHIYMCCGGQSVSEALIDLQYAKGYQGGAKERWTRGELKLIVGYTYKDELEESDQDTNDGLLTGGEDKTRQCLGGDSVSILKQGTIKRSLGRRRRKRVQVSVSP